MKNNPEDFEKKFSEMLEAEDLKEISEAFKSKSSISIKDVIFTMQALTESIEHLTVILSKAQDNEEESLSTLNSQDVQDFFNKLSISSDDFNESLVEYIIENNILEAGIDFIEDLEDDDED